MASIVSAGTTSATALNMSADTTGVLQLASNNGTVGLTIDTSQNVGINNSSSTIRTKLMVSSSNASDTLTVGTVSGGFSITNTNSSYGLQFGSLSTGNSWIQSARMDGTATAYNLLLQLGGGNVAIGTSTISSSSTDVLTVGKSSSSDDAKIIIRQFGANTAAGLSLVAADDNGAPYNSITSSTSGGTQHWRLGGAGGFTGGLAIATSGSERARFDSSGLFLVNGTSSSASTARIQAFVNGGNGATGWIGIFASGSNLANQNAGYMIGQSNLQLYSAWDGSGNPRNNVYVSAVSNGVQLSNGASSWSAISDARLKNVIGTYENALSDIAQIEPIKFTWKHDAESKPQVGVIAQSVQNVVPEAVEFGSHPNVPDTDAEYLSVRYTELIPLMIASIQELSAKVTALEEQVLNLGVK